MYFCRTPSETNVKTDSESTSNVDISAVLGSSAKTIKVVSYVICAIFILVLCCSLRL